MSEQQKKLAKQMKQLELEDRRSGFGVGGVEFQHALMAETDRGCALVAAEFLNDGLEFLLRERFSSTNTPKKVQDELVGNFAAPLGTLAMRARACLAFGLIDCDIFEAIERIREIRNKCGHRKGAIDLQDQEIKDQVSWLSVFNGRHPTAGDDGTFRTVGWPWWDDFGKKESLHSKERTAFMDAAFTVHDYLQSRITWGAPGQ